MNVIRILKRVTIDVVWMPVALLTLLVPRNRRLWAFGSSSGKKYADHSRMLFEGLHDNRIDADIRVVWSTKSDEIFHELTSRGYPVLKSNTFRGFMTTLRAGVCVYTHYANDHNRIAAFGAYKIQLWHGIPLKRFKAVSGLLEQGRAGRYYRNLHNRMLDLQKIMFPWANPTWDLLVFQSEVDRDRTGMAFDGTYRRGIVAGSVRIENLRKQFASPDCKPDEGDARKILYAPTHRALGRESLFEKVPVPDGNALHASLRRMGATMEVRLHPFQEREPVPEALDCGPVRLVDNGQCDDIYNDLHTFDILITDYSSIFIDVLPLGMPVIFLAPDYLEYSKDDQGFFSDKYSVPGPVATTWEEALYYCNDILIGAHDHWVECRRDAAKFYFDGSDESESAMKRIVDVAKRDLSIS
ncbi:CDP-glycerol glycerophosphotransferase (TagB/SpsB family) [Halomonas campaniensis]|uniref:CDP-glycerol glycerophosphotransferase (TagB/SpsB family) n=1 Tax=Halomonas campaniensis TaxID=213554 RepID=A0A7W5PAP8_9GAMM|nr:CDP-glycerol glycerophosphotransferase family protein [Halomonas campaniensis]MBB3330953.1 CDP-glycerol glycerophosphotransferase (TagB/SpsB family) [Halomonas campaniensis]